MCIVCAHTRSLFYNLYLFLANVNIGNNNNNANNQNMVMFTPMNGRKFARVRREAILEWSRERSDKKTLFTNRQLSKIFIDAIRFYLHFQHNSYSHFDSICTKRHNILGNYVNESNDVWRFIIQHVIDGVLEIAKSEVFCH